MDKPSILLVPGSFALPEFYNAVQELVTAKGFEIKGLHLPSVGLRAREGRPGSAPTIYEDAAFIDKEVEQLADQGRDVIVIGHSYGGVPISQCGKGLNVKERQQQGKSGGLVRLGYVTCLVPPIGENAVSVLQKAPSENQVPMETDVGRSVPQTCR
jgi:predicted alpha/beta hydrolase